MVTKFDHPDFVGGIVWSDCELRWINEKLAAAQAREAELVTHVERLRDAFYILGNNLGEFAGAVETQEKADALSGYASDCFDALAATPEQSLARVRNQVREECEIARDINDAMLNPKPMVENRPCAWEVRVRRVHPEVTAWRRYNIYETLERAQETVKRTDGPPIEVKIVPLYAALEES